MVCGVAENIGDGDDQLPRRAQQPRVVVVVEHLPGAPHHRVERPGDADGQPLDAARKRAVVVGLDDQVQVVALDAEFDHPQSEPAARQVEAVGDAPEAAPAAQVPHVPPHAQRDVHRCDAAEARPPGMRDAISARPSRAFSPAAVLAEMQ